jgi:hypothetical protein
MIPLQIYFNVPRKIVLGAIAALAAVVLGSVLIYETYARPLTAQFAGAQTNAGTVYLSPAAEAAAQAPIAAKTPMLEMHIANNGLTLLRGARVLSVSGSTIRVGIAWSSGLFTWDINTAYNTEFFGPTGQKETLADVQPGDIVTATGNLHAGGGEPAIDAQFVRE